MFISCSYSDIEAPKDHNAVLISAAQEILLRSFYLSTPPDIYGPVPRVKTAIDKHI